MNEMQKPQQRPAILPSAPPYTPQSEKPPGSSPDIAILKEKYDSILGRFKEETAILDHSSAYQYELPAIYQKANRAGSDLFTIEQVKSTRVFSLLGGVITATFGTAIYALFRVFETAVFAFGGNFSGDMIMDDAAAYDALVRKGFQMIEYSFYSERTLDEMKDIKTTILNETKDELTEIKRIESQYKKSLENYNALRKEGIEICKSSDNTLKVAPFHAGSTIGKRRMENIVSSVSHTLHFTKHAEDRIANVLKEAKPRMSEI